MKKIERKPLALCQVKQLDNKSITFIKKSDSFESDFFVIYFSNNLVNPGQQFYAAGLFKVVHNKSFNCVRPV